MISLADQSQPRGYPSLSIRIRKSYKNREVHVGVRPALRRARMGSDGLGWAFHHGEGCCQGVAMCPDGHRRRSIIRALVPTDSYPFSSSFSLWHFALFVIFCAFGLSPEFFGISSVCLFL